MIDANANKLLRSHSDGNASISSVVVNYLCFAGVP